MFGPRGGAGGMSATLTVSSAVTLLVFTLATAGAQVTCQTPESHALSRVRLLEATNGTELPWSPAPPGTRALYECDPGFLSLGDTERVCRGDGVWSGAASRCCLNIASQTNLAGHVSLVDGNMTTYVELSKLDNMDIDLYDLTDPDSGQAQSPPIIKEIRLITGGQSDLTGWTISATKSSPSDSCEGVDRFDVPLETKAYQFRGKQLWLHTFTTEACVGKFSIRGPSYPRRKDSSLAAALVYEMQLVAESTGLSRHQCQVPGDLGQAVLTGWTAGELCYYLVGVTMPHVDAEQWCQQLGSGGKLLQLRSAGLHSMVKDILRQQSTMNSWSSEFIWTARSRRRHEDSGTFSGEVQKYANGTAHKRETRPCPGVKQIKQWELASDSCDTKKMFICQAASSLCGSPAVSAGVRYDPPPSPALRAANVTCAGHRTASGQVECRARRWTQPTFCDNSGVLGTVMASVAGVVLLLGCVLIAAASYMRHKRNNESGWESYTFLRRLSRLSRYGVRQQGLAVNLTADHTYSEPVYRDVPAQESRRRPTASWLHGHQMAAVPTSRRRDGELPPPPPPSSNPPTSAGTAKPLHDSHEHGKTTPDTGSSQPAVEYCVPLVQGRRQSPNLNFTTRSRDGAAVAGGEYAVPYDARMQGASERVGAPPDVVTSTVGSI